MNYSLFELAQILIKASSDVEYRLELNDTEYEFEDASVFVTGNIYVDYDYDKGDFWTPPTCSLSNRTADIYEVTVCYDESEHKLSNDELYELEKMIRK